MSGEALTCALVGLFGLHALALRDRDNLAYLLLRASPRSRPSRTAGWEQMALGGAMPGWAAFFSRDDASDVTRLRVAPCGWWGSLWGIAAPNVALGEETYVPWSGVCHALGVAARRAPKSRT